MVNDFLKLGSDFMIEDVHYGIDDGDDDDNEAWMFAFWLVLPSFPKRRLADSHETRLYRGLVMKRLTVQTPKVDAGSMYPYRMLLEPPVAVYISLSYFACLHGLFVLLSMVLIFLDC